MLPLPDSLSSDEKMFSDFLAKCDIELKQVMVDAFKI
jgi:hypothetical protein